MAKIFKIFEGDQGPFEPILEPEIPIIDAHHHLWPVGSPIADYPIETFLDVDVLTGHNVIATVFAECMACYHEGGDEAQRPVGETEFVVKHCPILPGRPAVAAAWQTFTDVEVAQVAGDGSFGAPAPSSTVTLDVARAGFALAVPVGLGHPRV